MRFIGNKFWITFDLKVISQDFVDEMPMNASEKVLKRQLKEQIERKAKNKN